MSSYLSTKSNTPNVINTSSNTPNIEKPTFISMNTLKWLQKQLWAWILFGIFIMSIFFYIAKGLIVFISGTILGMYLFNIYGKDNNSSNDNQIKNINNTLVNNTMKYVKNGINNMTQSKPDQIEGFEGYKLFSIVWWKNSRV